MSDSAPAAAGGTHDPAGRALFPRSRARREARRLPVETLAAPLTGYKLGQLLLAVDGKAVTFAGLSIGSHTTYGVVAEATCIFNAKHVPPDPSGDCGFYCLNTADRARDVAADTTYRGGVLLEVAASGRFIRYELGLRYERQRVTAVRIGLCACGRRADAFCDAGTGHVGWRRLLPVCEVCAAHRPVVTPERIASLLPGIPVTPDPGVRPIDDSPLPASWESSGDAKVALLSAEVSLLQARLDSVQSKLSSLDEADAATAEKPDGPR